MRRKHQIPSDFPDQWNNSSIRIVDLAKIYNVSPTTIAKWKVELGLPRRVVGLQDKSKHREWKRGVSERPDEYRMIWMPDHPHACQNGYIREHRYVMEQHLGRYLTPKEVVHHKDGDRQNNLISNLELFSDNPDHLTHTTRFEFPPEADLADLYNNQRLSTHAIAKMFGTCTVVVRRALKRLGVKTRSRAESRKNPKMPSREEIERLWRDHSIPEIAAMFDVSDGALSAHCHYIGLKAPTEEARNRRKSCNYPSDDILQGMTRRMTTKAMAEELGVSYYGLASYMSIRGIHKRPKPKAVADPTPPESTPTSRLGQQPCAQE